MLGGAAAANIALATAGVGSIWRGSFAQLDCSVAFGSAATVFLGAAAGLSASLVLQAAARLDMTGQAALSMVLDLLATGQLVIPDTSSVTLTQLIKLAQSFGGNLHLATRIDASLQLTREIGGA